MNGVQLHFITNICINNGKPTTIFGQHQKNTELIKSITINIDNKEYTSIPVLYKPSHPNQMQVVDFYAEFDFHVSQSIML